jgi:hypothetical protein
MPADTIHNKAKPTLTLQDNSFGKALYRDASSKHISTGCEASMISLAKIFSKRFIDRHIATSNKQEHHIIEPGRPSDN